MWYTYVLQSVRDKKLYTGVSNDLRRRFSEHQRGKVFSTKWRRPLKIIYYETCVEQRDAEEREKYLKTAWGKRYLKNRLKKYLAESLD